MPNVGNFADLCTVRVGHYYGRTNSALYVPTKYLLSLFEDGDNRYEYSFISTYSSYSYNKTGMARGSATITQGICDTYGIDPSWIVQ